jgi:hypothetical protein
LLVLPIRGEAAWFVHIEHGEVDLVKASVLYADDVEILSLGSSVSSSSPPSNAHRFLLSPAANSLMLAHEIFDPETNKRVLVDHAFIVAGGEITKAARNWIGNALDAPKRSQIMFMDRDDILNLYVVTNLPLPADALPRVPASQGTVRSDEPPF